MREMVEAAVHQLCEAEVELLERNVAERAIAARLAELLRPLFPDHDVDVEYDRHGLLRKSLQLPRECRGGGERLVIPDIVVHRRGIDEHNLLVVEVKKQTNRESRACDRAKLRAMVAQLSYRAGVLVDVPAGPGAAERRAIVEWY